MPNSVIAKVREKYPQYDSVSDDELTDRLAAKFPAYLSIPDFKADADRVVGSFSESPEVAEDASRDESRNAAATDAIYAGISKTVAPPPAEPDYGESPEVMADVEREENRTTVSAAQTAAERFSATLRARGLRGFDQAAGRLVGEYLAEIGAGPIAAQRRADEQSAKIHREMELQGREAISPREFLNQADTDTRKRMLGPMTTGMQPIPPASDERTEAGGVTGAVAGAQNFAAAMADFMTSPVGVFAIAAPGVAGSVGGRAATSEAHRRMAQVFALDMARNAPEQAKATYEAIKAGDTAGAVEGTINGLLTLAIFHGAARRPGNLKALRLSDALEMAEIEGRTWTESSPTAIRREAGPLRSGDVFQEAPVFAPEPKPTELEYAGGEMPRTPGVTFPVPETLAPKTTAAAQATRAETTPPPEPPKPKTDVVPPPPPPSPTTKSAVDTIRRSVEIQEIDSRLEAGAKPVEKTVDDVAGRVRLEAERDRLNRTGAIGNPNHPDAQRLAEINAELRTGGPFKTEYRLVNPDSSFRRLNKTEFDYANSVRAKSAQTEPPKPAEPAPAEAIGGGLAKIQDYHQESRSESVRDSKMRAVNDVLEGYDNLQEAKDALASNAPDAVRYTPKGFEVNNETLADAIRLVEKEPSLVTFKNKFVSTAPKAKPPELMTPEEFADYSLTAWPTMPDANRRPILVSTLNAAIRERKPINAALAESVAQGKTPSGYVREGDRYVFKPAVKETPAAEPAKPVRVARGVSGRTRLNAETETTGHDVLDFLANEMPVLSKTAAREKWGAEKFKTNASDWDDAPSRLSAIHHNAIYGVKVSGGTAPNVAAQAAFERGLIKEPTASALWAAVKDASQKRAGHQARAKTETAFLDEQGKALESWEKATADGKQEVTAEDLHPGDVLDVEGERVKVAARDPETGDLTLEDGTRFGTQTLPEGKRIYVEKHESAGEATTEFLPPETPKLGSGEKGTGELFKGEDQPFNLAGERTVDAERVAREKSEAERRSAEAKAAAEKAQPGLPGAEVAKPKWTSATDEPPLGGALYGPFGIPSPAATARAVAQLARQASPHVRAAARAVADFGREAVGDLGMEKLTDRRRAVMNWSAKLQRSFGEAEAAQREIQSKVKDPAHRDGVSNWIEAGGDPDVLRDRLARTIAWRDPATGKPHPLAPQLIKGYEAALNLTPAEIAAAKDVKSAFDALGQRAQAHDVLHGFQDDYVTHVWKLNQGPALGSTRTLKDQFRFAKARSFSTYFEGEQAGYVPKTKDISKILPVYLHEMNATIAARQLAAELSRGLAKDGLPLVRMRGSGTPVNRPQGQAVLVRPQASAPSPVKYETLPNQPALRDWTWVSRDTAGKNVFLKADMELHPEAHVKLKAALSRSAIKNWYDTRTTAVMEIPKAIVKGLDAGQSETKRTMLGFFAPFHQVQEGTHAVGHRINPFRAREGGLIDRATGGALPEGLKMPKIDLVNDPRQMKAARRGLMLLPDRASANQFMEGYRVSGLTSKLPVVGKWADAYSRYLFHEYIPGLKYLTYEAILERNTKVYEKDLAAGKVTPDDVGALSATQANAAYGHLNYADLGRDPTVQHLLQLGLLAPDFFEARARFFGQAVKGVTGAKVGREQLIALSFLAVAQAALAYTAAQLTDGEWEGSRPFEFRKGDRRYTLRSVPEDAVSLARDLAHVFEKGGETPFISHRLSPIIGRGGLQLFKGSDYRGQPVTPMETAQELLKAPIPITLRGLAGELPWIGDLLKPNTPLTITEQQFGALGLKIQRFNPQAEVYRMVDEFKRQSGDEKLVEQAEQRAKEIAPESSYRALRDALYKNNLAEARREYDKLVPLKGNAKNTAAEIIDQAMAPHTINKKTFERRDKPFTGSAEFEKRFVASLSPAERKVYQQARDERTELYRRFRLMLQEERSRSR